MGAFSFLFAAILLDEVDNTAALLSSAPMVVSALAAAPRARGATAATEEMEGWMRMMALSKGVSGGSERGDASLGQRHKQCFVD